jgi:hypothetical protein
MSTEKPDPANREAYLRAIRAWYSDEYQATLDLDNIPNPALREFLGRSELQLWSHKNRLVRNTQIMKHSFVYNKTDNITVCFKITLDATSCIYAFLYCRCDGRADNRADTTGGGGADSRADSGATIVPEFVCTGPTYRSQDGEYRGRMISWRQLGELFTKYAGPFSEIERAILAKLTAGRLSFQSDFYFPLGCNYGQEKLEEFINNNRLPLKLYILCWAYDFYNVYHKTMENHINPAYQLIIYQPEDIPVFEGLIADMGQQEYSRMLSRICNHYATIYNDDFNIAEPQVGQKIFPLTAIEAVKIDDINFNVWREVYVANLTSNLVLNLISPSFPFIINWFYIQNAHAGLFDNFAMHNKYVHSDVAADISSQLKAIDKYNYSNESKKKQPISGKFLRLSKSIHKSIIYADSDIRLTDLAVCVMSEYVGRTLRDIPALIIHKEALPGLELSFTDPGIFTKHMFEFIYAFYTMNTKIGIIHGDLHMNNATISRLYYVLADTIAERFRPRDPKVAYVIGDAAYAFPHTGLFSTIIDFSRAIIGSYERIEHEFSQRFADMYFKEQRERVLQMIYHYFPKLLENNRLYIESLLLSKFPLMFKILTAIDTYVIMSNIRAMFSIDDVFTHGRIKIAPAGVKLLDALIHRAEALVQLNIKAAVDGKITSPDDIEWPNLVLMQENFSSYKLRPEDITPGAPNTIIEIFNSNNAVRYDIEHYDTWGPLLTLEKELELRREYKQDMNAGIQRWMEYKKMDETPRIEALTSKYEQQEREVLQMRAWMLM